MLLVHCVIHRKLSGENISSVLNQSQKSVIKRINAIKPHAKCQAIL